MRRMMGKISAEDINDIRFVRIVIRHDGRLLWVRYIFARQVWLAL